MNDQISSDWEDKEIFDAYLQKIDVKEKDYKAFLNQRLSIEELKAIPYFSEYVINFLASTRLQKLKTTRNYINATNTDQQKMVLNLFYIQQMAAEQEKLYYFALIYKQNTLIITAPSTNDEQKRFLGYDWSNRRGNEGIQIHTPGGMLYNDQNRYATDTLATVIRHAYNEMQPVISAREQYYTFARLQDMIEFARPTFNKEIKLTADKKILISSKYPLVKLGTIAEVLKGKSITKAQTTEGNVKVVAGGTNYAYLHNVANRAANTITISASGANAGFVNFWAEPIFASDCTTVRGKNEIETLFLYNFLHSIQDQIYYLQKGAAQPHVYPDDIAELLIPQIDEKLMKKVVSECKKVDDEYNTSRMTIDEYRRKIAQVFENLQVITGGGKLKLSNKNIFEICIGKRILNSEVSSDYTIPVYSANVFEPFGMINKQLLTDFSKDSILWGIDGDWMVNVIPANTPFYPTDHCGVLRVKTDDVLPKYMAYLLQKEGERAGFKRSYRASIDRISSLTINVAPIEAQRQAIALVEQYEAEIKRAEAVMVQTANKKKAILDKYLN